MLTPSFYKSSVLIDYIGIYYRLVYIEAKIEFYLSRLANRLHFTFSILYIHLILFLPNFKQVSFEMAGIRTSLQKELFDAENQRILSVCRVINLLNKQKKASYLALVQTPTQPENVQVVQVLHEKGECKRKRSWSIEEVKVVDGKDVGESSEFDMQMDKMYHWIVPNPHERQNFIVLLWKYMKQTGTMAAFVNIPQSWLTEAAVRMTAEQQKDDISVEACDDNLEDFQALTEREELQLTELFSNSRCDLRDAERFIEEMLENLSNMDGANIQSVLASEEQVNRLMTELETAIMRADGIAIRLSEYDSILCHIRDSIEKMGEKNVMIAIANNNNQKLLLGLDGLVQKLDLPYQHQKCLMEPDLTSQVGLDAAVAAAKALQACINADINSDLLPLSAVQDQIKRVEKLKQKFSQVLSRHLNNMFIHLGNDVGHSACSPETQLDLVLPKHTNVHKELAPFAELMQWLKIMDEKSFDKLTKIYTNSLSKIYDREIQQFFSAARSQIHLDDVNPSVEIGAKASKNPLVQYGMIGINRELWPNGLDSEERKKIEHLLETVLANLEPVALSEQKFCIAFFRMESTTSYTQSRSTDALNSSIERSGDAPTGESVLSRADKQINQEVRQMMTELFGSLESELIQFIMGFEKLDIL